MSSTSFPAPASGAAVPLARRQLGHDRLKLVLAIAGAALAVALVGLLFGLRSGIARQVTTYLDNAGADVYVAQGGTRNFVSSSSVLSARDVARIRAAAPDAVVEPIAGGVEPLTLRGRKRVTMLIGFEPGRLGGPWQMAAGRPPQGAGEVAVDRVLARTNGIATGDRLPIRGASLRVVGLTDGTSSWMTSLLFTTRAQANALQRRGDVATSVLVRSDAPRADLRARLARALPDLSVFTRADLAGRDRTLIADTFSAPLLVMVLVAFGVGALVIGLMVYGFVAERRREFGMLKAIGARNGRLYRLVAVHALAIAALGLVAGVALQRLASLLLQELAPKFVFVFEARYLFLMIVAAAGMALLGAWVPARIVARLDPAEVFRR